MEEGVVRRLQIEPERGFRILARTDRAQAATMVLEAGEATGGPHNKHVESDQWLYVISGQGRAVVSDTHADLRPGTLLLIEAGEAHEIVNTGDRPLETLNLYSPPEF